MSKLKTTENQKSVSGFIKTIKNDTQRADCSKIIDLMSRQIGLEPKMWGPSIIGFGAYHYKYASGHEGDMPLAAFSPRSSALVFYFCEGFDKKAELLLKLGKHKTGKGCVYIKKLDDIDISILEKMIVNSIAKAKSAL